MAKFSEIGLKKEIVSILTKLKFIKAFEVQEKVIPLTLQKQNIVFTSRTGSGKTLAYTIGFLSKINKKMQTQMLILVPTRELAIQVAKEITQLTDLLGFNVGVIYGGREIYNDHLTLKKRNHIMVGTPGRLITHINDKTLKVGDVKCLVFDESDQMFDQGFFDDCEYIKSRVSKSSQIILSSATISEKVRKFIDEVVVDYKLIEIGDNIPKNITQEIIFVEIPDKQDLLVKLLSEKKYKKVLVFCNRKDNTYDLTEFLNEKNIYARRINSDLIQVDRENTLNLFKHGKIHVLVATDIAARGLHIEQVDLVINYDVPNKAEFYVHRIGRSGRVDKPGHSITFICKEDVDRWGDVLFDYQPNVKEITL